MRAPIVKPIPKKLWIFCCFVLSWGSREGAESEDSVGREELVPIVIMDKMINENFIRIIGKPLWVWEVGLLYIRIIIDKLLSYHQITFSIN